MAINAGAIVYDVLADASKVGRQVKQDIGSQGGTFAGVGKGIGGKLVAGFAALGVGAILTEQIAAGLDAEKANDKLAATYDLTAKESAKAGRIAGRLFSEAYGADLGEVNAALAGIQDNVGDLGSFTDAQLKGMGANALDLATIMDEDVGRVTRGVGQLMRNDLAPNATAAFDLITAAVQDGGNATDDLLDTIEEYSADLSSLGLSGPQALGMLSAALDAGARNTDLAVDALRELSITAVDGSKLTAEGFALAGLNAGEMSRRIAEGGPTAAAATSEIIRAVTSIKDPLKRNAAGVALFGTRFEELGPKVIAAMDPATASLDNVGGAADRMGEKLNDNAQTRVDAYIRKLQVLAINVVGNTLIPALDDAADAIENTLGPVFADATETIERSNGTAITSFRDLVRTLTNSSLSFGTKFGLIWDDIWSENTTKEQRHVNTFWRILRGLWQRTIGDLIKYAGDFIRGSSKLWRDSKAAVTGFGRAFVTALRNTWRTASVSLRGFVAAFSNALRNTWRSVTSGLRGFVSAFSRTLRDTWRAMTNAVRGFVTSFIRTFTGAFTRVTRVVRTWSFVVGLAFNNAMSGITKVVSRRLTSVVRFFQQLPGRIAGAVSNLKSTIANKVSSVLSGIKAKINIGAIFGDGFGIGARPGGGGGASTRGLTPRLQAAAGVVRKLGGHITSGFRGGSITSTGNRSYHGKGRAIDIGPPSMGLFTRIRALFPAATELIYTPAGRGQLWHGQSHVYRSGSVQRDHYDHIHLALAKGGYFRKPTRAYDVQLAERGPEIVSPVPMMREVMASELARASHGDGLADQVTLIVEGTPLTATIERRIAHHQRVARQRGRAGVR